MRRLFMLLGVAVAAAALWAPSAALAHPSSEASQAVVAHGLDASAAAPSPTPSQPAGSTPGVQVVPTGDDSTTLQDALTIVGFSVIAMIGLVLVLRAGLRSAGAEDDD